MENAIKAINNNEMGRLRASKAYNVPFATLRRRCGTNKIAVGHKKEYLGGKR